MAETLNCDVAILGGGLAGGLVALALAARRPDLEILLIEANQSIGGNHVWSFFESDVTPADRWLVDPLVSHAWRSYDIAFPRHERCFETAYFSIESERLDLAVRSALPATRILTGRRVVAASPRSADLDEGTRVEAGGVIDARGVAILRHLELGWQKFVGHELQLEAPHKLQRPIVMDATVEQLDGYRFVYSLPFAADRVFVEDTYYSDAPVLEREVLAERIARYAQAKGWRVAEVLRRESGVLPVVMGGDFEAYWNSDGGEVGKVGMRAGMFHPTTGYSLPDAVRTAVAIAGAADLSGPALHGWLHDRAKQLWDERGFYRMLDRMLFRAADPPHRYRVLERFYGLRAPLIARFYAGRATTWDKARILAGKPPVPLGRALAAIGGTRR